MLETVTKSVVGISKLSSTGGSILNNIKSDELGLGTGIIVSQDGYILSNSHVTGEKYSNNGWREYIWRKWCIPDLI